MNYQKNAVEAGMIDLKIEDPEEKEISLSSLKGKVVLLNFWASWNSESRDLNQRLKAFMINTTTKDLRSTLSPWIVKSRWKKCNIF